MEIYRMSQKNPIAKMQPQSEQVQANQPPMSKPKPQGQLLLELTAISGEYPADNIHRLIASASYAKKVITALTGDKLIRLVNKGGIRGYRLELKGKKKLLTANNARFADYLDGAADTNKQRSDHSRRLRLHAAAEVYTLMYNANVQIFKDIKPKIYLPTAAADPSQSALSQSALAVTTPCFYSSREHKMEYERSNAIRGSRAVGALLTSARVYAIYNTGVTESRWRESVETRYRVDVHDYICRKLLYSQYKGGEISGIMLGEKLGLLEKYLLPQAKKETGYKFLTRAYRHFYFITNDSYGEAQLRLLCDNAKMHRLKTTLTKKFLPPNTKYPIEHDALTEDGSPVLFCCLLDVPRLVQFKMGVILHGKRGKVIAFDFQKEMLESYLGADAEVRAINFESIIEWLNQQSHKGDDSM
ncbi:MAG: hypothetical protein FWG87_01720 [Defluviitaleaceae bacterium]|nr:hypothetical protein [Defluviitaleaceae bacterium]